jgi:hypothetical protein
VKPGTGEKTVEPASQLAWREQTDRPDVKDVKVYDTAGKQIDAKALPALLKKETPALYRCDGEKPDPLHLRTVKEGTLVFVWSAPKAPRLPVRGTPCKESETRRSPAWRTS